MLKVFKILRNIAGSLTGLSEAFDLKDMDDTIAEKIGASMGRKAARKINRTSNEYDNLVAAAFAEALIENIKDVYE